MAVNPIAQMASQAAPVQWARPPELRPLMRYGCIMVAIREDQPHICGASTAPDSELPSELPSFVQVSPDPNCLPPCS